MNQRWEDSECGRRAIDIPYFCNLVPSSSPNSAAWCCGQIDGFAYLSPGEESCMQRTAQTRVYADRLRSPFVSSSLGLTH